MPYTPPNVYYASVFDGTYTKIEGVQSVNITRGKSLFQEPTTASRCTIEVTPTSTFPSMTIGQFIDIRDTNSGSSSAYFAGKITNIQRTYAIPYNSSTGATPADRVTISVTGGTGQLASGAGAASGGAGIEVDAAYVFMTLSMDQTAVYCITPQNIGFSYANNVMPVIGTGQRIMQPPITGPWFDICNEVMNTVQYSVDDLDLNRTFKANVNNQLVISAGAYFYPTGQTGQILNFVDDGTTGSTTYKYGQIEYSSSVQSAFSQVLLQYQGFGVVSGASAYYDIQTVVNQGSKPYVGFSYTNWSYTTAQATALGNYVLTVNSSTTPTPFTIGTNTAMSSTASELGKLANCPIGTAVTVKFRGTTVNATVCGISANYYPGVANIRLSLTPSLGTPFTLNSTAFGVLDQNRLGYP